MARRLCCLTALVCWLLAASAAAARDDGLLEGELGRWLDQTAAELGETLSRHPRFEAETVRLVILSPGDRSGHSNRLAQAVERRLRQRLLEIEGVRLAADEPQRDCEPPVEIGYLVRVELAAAGRRQGRVHLAVVDVAESVWVSGISHQWQGALTGAERDALDDAVVQAQPGSAGSPIPLDDAGAVAAALKGHLLCTLPRGLDGALFVAVPEPVSLTRVGLALQSELMYESLAAVTADRSDARWLLTFDAGDSAADVRELNLTLADVEGGHRQRVASVFVSGDLGDGAAPGTATPAAEAPDVGSSTIAHRSAVPAAGARPTEDEPGVLSALEMRPARPEGICDNRRARINSCVEVTFELLEPAYLFVVSTSAHTLVEAPCDAALERADPGRRRYRMRVPPGNYAVDASDTGPDAGLYVLAVRERGVARELRDALARAPGACRGGGDAAGWLGELARVLDRHSERVAWRTLHVAHDTAGIVALGGD